MSIDKVTLCWLVLFLHHYHFNQPSTYEICPPVQEVSVMFLHVQHVLLNLTKVGFHRF